MLNALWQSRLEAVDFAFQPIVNSLSGSLFAVEALLRHYDSAGFSSIDEFFNTAFSEDILFALDIELRKKALRKFKEIPFYRRIKLFYNYDPRTHQMPGYRTGVTEDLLDEIGLPCECLCFELSERHPMHPLEEYTRLLGKARERGFRIALDDFGVGYSSFELFYHSEPDYIKFDRFLVQDIDRDPRKRSFCSHLVNLACIQGAVVIAEGIEREGEYLTCADLGITYMQGFLIQRPTLNVSDLQETYRPPLVGITYDKRQSASDKDLVSSHIKRYEAVRVDDDISVLFDKFHRNSNISFFPVIDSQDSPLGIIHENSIKSYIYSPYGYDLLRNKSVTSSLRKYITPCPSADINAPQERILEIFVSHPQSAGILITHNSRYEGFLDGKALLNVIHEKNLCDAREINPLTKLPGNILINRYISRALSGNDPCFFIYFDIDNFKPFNDRFGFRQGDRLILLFAEILKSHFSGRDSFLGHIGGDDFFGGIRRPLEDFEVVASAARDLISDFTYSARTFHSREELKSGGYRARNREGRETFFPFLTASAAILGVSEGGWNINLDTVNRSLAELKKRAKEMEGRIACSLIHGNPCSEKHVLLKASP